MLLSGRVLPVARFVCLWLLMKLVCLGCFIPVDCPTNMSNEVGYSNLPADCSFSSRDESHFFLELCTAYKLWHLIAQDVDIYN